MSVRDLFGQLAGIEETVLLFHDAGKRRPRATRMLTDMTKTRLGSPKSSTSTTHPLADLDRVG